MKYFVKSAKLREDIDNLKYLLKHKYYIMAPGRELGLKYPQLLVHDLSKFTPGEWSPYRDYFFSESGIQRSNNLETKRRFREAVESKHYKRNKHHYLKSGKEVPLKYQLEAVADWYASAKAQSSNSKSFPQFADWYSANESRFTKITPSLKQYISEKIR